MTTVAKKMGPGYKSGFVAIVGRPNAGKSTLVNRLVGQKVAIVTSKPQTTRNRIQGIVTRENAQVVLIDTPGLHDAKTALNKQMMREVAAALEGIDVLLLMADASATQPHADSLLLDKSKRFAGKTILVLNKVDKVPKQKLLPLLDVFGKAQEFAAIVPISALKGDGCDALMDEVMKLLPEGQAFFSGQRNCSRKSDCADLSRGAPCSRSDSRQMGRSAETAANSDDADRGACFAEEDPDWPQRRHDEKDWHASPKRTGRDFEYEDLSRAIRQGGGELARKSDGRSRIGLARTDGSAGRKRRRPLTINQS